MAIWLPVVVGVIAQFVMLAFFYGKLVGSVSAKLEAQDLINEELKETDREQWGSINAIDQRVARIEGSRKANGHA